MLDQLLAKITIPDLLITTGIRALNRKRLRMETCSTAEEQQEKLQLFCRQLIESPIAVNTDAANRQHYELPPRFFQWILGPHLKYSSAFWPKGVESLAEAEEEMLIRCCQRADLQDGQKILELGCGWGSLALFMAARYPRAEISALSNSTLQKRFIDSTAKERGLKNLKVIREDINHFHSRKRYDRIVSVEMFEHLRNYALLFERIYNWLLPQGKLFVHIFSHRQFAYLFDSEGSDNWMGRYFFTGGIMPSRHLLFYFCHPLQLKNMWQVDGYHYEKTARAWLKNLDRRRSQVLDLFKEVYGSGQEKQWLNYWRIFLLAVAELFGFREGQEWGVSHYLFSRRN